jgi:hypothetical protein
MLGVKTEAVFHWPWLVRLSAKQLLTLDALPSTLKDLSPHGTAFEVTEATLSTWLMSNISWRLELRLSSGSTPKDDGVRAEIEKPAKDLESFGRALKALRRVNHDADIRSDINDWARQLYVMTAPYFGLPGRLALKLRQSLSKAVPKDALSLPRIAEEQDQMIGDAIQYEPNTTLSSQDREQLTIDFYRKREERLDDEERTLWIGRVRDPGDKVRSPKPSS